MTACPTQKVSKMRPNPWFTYDDDQLTTRNRRRIYGNMLLRSGMSTGKDNHKVNKYRHSDNESKIYTRLSAQNSPSKADRSDRDTWNLLITYFSIFIYVWSYYIQAGGPTYVRQVRGYVNMFKPLLNLAYIFIGLSQIYLATIMMRIEKRYGAATALKLPLFLASISYGINSFSNTFLPLFPEYSHYIVPFLIWPSLFKHAILGAQMVVTDIAKRKNYVTVLGILGMVSGLAMMSGPYIAERVNDVLGESNAVLLASIAMLTCVVLLHVMLPCKHRSKRHGRHRKDESMIWRTISFIGMDKIVYVMEFDSRIPLLFLMTTALSFPPIAFGKEIMEEMAIQGFGMEIYQRDYFVMYMDMVTMLTQGVLVGYLSKEFEENSLIMVAANLICVAWIFLSYVKRMHQLLFVMVLMNIGLVIQKMITQGALINSMAKIDKGYVLGASYAIQTVVRFISPKIGELYVNGIQNYNFANIATAFTIVITVFFYIRTYNEGEYDESDSSNESSASQESDSPNDQK